MPLLTIEATVVPVAVTVYCTKRQVCRGPRGDSLRALSPAASCTGGVERLIDISEGARQAM